MTEKNKISCLSHCYLGVFGYVEANLNLYDNTSSLPPSWAVLQTYRVTTAASEDVQSPSSPLWLLTVHFITIKPKEMNFGGFLKNPKAHGLFVRCFIKHFLKPHKGWEGSTPSHHTPHWQDTSHLTSTQYLPDAKFWGGKRRGGEQHQPHPL